MSTLEKLFLALAISGWFTAIVLGLNSISIAERCGAAERIIDQVWEDQPDYCLDVLTEGDIYQEWVELAE